ncbi:MAG: cobalamin biosynthesis protein CobD [Planctomycetes bacterium]|nr:cobalamin biosynthesis protein CobD [Planctomycetota bacterium]
MRLEYQILAAAGLDLLLGDPRWLPHPVQGIGRLAAALDTPFRRAVKRPRLAGALIFLVVFLATGLVTAGVVCGAYRLHPYAGDAVSIVVLYMTFAARDLMRHSMDVYRALKADDLDEARRRVGLIVGRDADQLDEPGVVRAAVESIAENLVDGVTAPLFFGVLGGPVGAMLYKAVNTLDSTFGYKDERYIDFGWVPAKMDDVVNFIPARLTAPLVAVAAVLLRRRPVAALRVLFRDGRKHTSPNAGLTEAAVAGALGVQLGGVNIYFGKPSEKPTLGDPVVPLDRSHIIRANALMLTTAGLAGALFLGTRWIVLCLCCGWGGNA